MNRLIDDCLFLIFEQLYDLHDLINCHKVCMRWKYLIEIRLAKFRYLTVYDSSGAPHIETNRIPNEVLVNLKRLQYILGHRLRWKGDYVCPLKSVTRETFPNLKIVHFDPSPGIRSSDFIKNDLELVYKTMRLRGLLEMSIYATRPITTRNLDLEMYGSCSSYYFPLQWSLKQLRIKNVQLDQLPNHLNKITKLEILYLELFDLRHEIPRDPKPFYPNLETLIVVDREKSSNSFMYELELINCCPKLKNAHFLLLNKTLDFTGDQFSKNPRLDSLVIVFGANSSWKWISLKTQLYKYPNMKNLALRLYPEIFDSYLNELVQTLPYLVTLDLRGCENITDESVKFIERYNKLAKRSIKIHIGPRYEVPPRPHHWLGTGSNFMDAFFYRDRTPLILDKLDD